MIDQYQQGCGSIVLQLTLQGTEIEIVALEQLLRLEQVRNDQDVDWALVLRGQVRRS